MRQIREVNQQTGGHADRQTAIAADRQSWQQPSARPHAAHTHSSPWHGMAFHVTLSLPLTLSAGGRGSGCAGSSGRVAASLYATDAGAAHASATATRCPPIRHRSSGSRSTTVSRAAVRAASNSSSGKCDAINAAVGRMHRNSQCGRPSVLCSRLCQREHVSSGRLGCARCPLHRV